MSQILYFASERVEFLSRELGWSFRPRDNLKHELKTDFLSPRKISILLIGNDAGELEYLDDLPPDSVWVYLYADETYLPALNLNLLRTKAVRGIIRAYPTRQARFRSLILIFIKSLLITLSKSSIQDGLRLILQVPKGLIYLFRKTLVSGIQRLEGKEGISLMPGYTNLFAGAYCNKYSEFLNSTSSLLKFSEHKSIESNSKPLLINFVGQKGKWWRQYALSQARNYFTFEEAKLETRVGFGGTLGSNGASSESAREYLDAMDDSYFTLCPPGNYSYGSFRILEALICQSIPVYAPIHSWDALFKPPWLDRDWKAVHQSWGDVFISIKRFRKNEFEKTIESQIASARQYLAEVNSVLLGNMSVLYLNRDK